VTPPEEHLSPALPAGPGTGRLGNRRWIICALLFFATTVNYMDRQVIGILAPTLHRELHWSERDYSNIVTAFQIAYAAGLLVSGPLIDYVGTRLGYALAIFVWSAAAALHGAMRSVTGFATARFLLGLGEAGNFPAAIKTVAEWFPRRERALAVGVFNAGCNIGAIVAPLTVPWIALHLGWPWAFYLTGAVGLLWLVFWLPGYHKPQDHPRLSPAELAYIQSDPADPVRRVPWLSLLSYPQTWAFVAAKFLPDAVWWFYLYWAPKFFDKNFGISLSGLAGPLVAIYLIADVGSIGGGWLSSSLIKRGWSVNAARKTTMLICALCIIPVTYAPHTTHMWTAVLLIGLAAAAHQGWSANAFTLASDMFPRSAVGSVVGLGGMSGAVGGILMAQFIGTILEWTGSYTPIFVVAGSTYLVALLFIHQLAPRLTPVSLPPERKTSRTCAKCGYDLRGSPSNVCPECGSSKRDNP
jgi:ACS family hexuronate transporter-like MFS transporter